MVDRNRGVICIHVHDGGPDQTLQIHTGAISVLLYGFASIRVIGKARGLSSSTDA